MSLPLNLISSYSGFHRRKVVSLAFSPDGDLLLSTARDSTALLFEVGTGRLLAALELDSTERPTCSAWQDQSHFWLGSSDGTVTLWFVERGGNQPLRITNALPFHLPATPSLIFVRNEAQDPCPYIVVGYGDSAFEVWGRRGVRATWEAQGHSTSVGPGQPLSAWPVLRDAVIVIFRHKGARLWKFREDELKCVVGWPTGSLWELAQYLPSDAAEISVGSNPSIAGSRPNGHVVLIGDGCAQILALSFEPIPYMALLRTIPCSQGLHPRFGTLTNWAGHPTLLVPDEDDVKAFDLSASAYQAALSLKTVQADVNAVMLTEICAQTLEPKGLQATLVAAFSSRFGRHVAAAHALPNGGWGISVWSATHGSVSCGALQQNVPKIRFHSEMQSFVARLNGVGSLRQKRHILSLLLLCVLAIIAAIASRRTYIKDWYGLEAIILVIRQWVTRWIVRAAEETGATDDEPRQIDTTVIIL